MATGDLKVSTESIAESSSMTNIIAIDDEGPSHAHVESDSLEKASSTKQEADASKRTMQNLRNLFCCLLWIIIPNQRKGKFKFTDFF